MRLVWKQRGKGKGRALVGGGDGPREGGKEGVRGRRGSVLSSLPTNSKALLLFSALEHIP